MRKMENRLKLDSEVRDLKLGTTFTNPNPRTVFHTLKYDFKPASVDTTKPATLEVGTNKQVTVTVPHNDTSGVPNTVFKGNQRDYTRKECVLIIDRVTGEITLEKLNSNVQVKKTRTESKVQPPPPPPQIKVSENSTARLSSRTKITTGSRKNNPISLVPKHSPLQNSPSYPNKSPLSAPVWNANNTQQTLPSIPLIGLDDGNDFLPVPSSSVPQSQPVQQQHQQQQQQQSQHHGHNSLGLPSMNNIGGGGGGSSHHNNSHNSQNNSNNSHSVNQQQQQHQQMGMNSSNQHQQQQQQQHQAQHNPYSNNNHHNSNSNSNNNSESNNMDFGLPSLLGQASPPRDTGFSTGLLSSSSSDSSGSSDSDSGSESDSTTEDNNDSPVKESIFDIGPARSSDPLNSRPLPTHILSQDLCLSESNSDSD